MSIQFYAMPSTILKPGVYGEQNYRLASNTLADFLQEVMLIAQRLGAYIEPARWQGGTLNDCDSGGTYTGAGKTDILVEIDAADTPDTFKWSKDGGATWEVETVAVTGSAQTLENGITITFGATTGHAVGDQWVFGAWAEPSVAQKIPTAIFSDADAGAYFGYGSNAHLMAKAALEANRYLRLHACALDDAGGGTQSAGTITIGGTVTVAGNLKLWTGKKLIEINVALADTAAEIAIALQNEIAKYLDELPVYVAVDQSTPEEIDVTAKHKGTMGDQIGLAYETTAGGITIAIGAMASGATDPDADDALDACAAGDYDLYVCPWNDNTNIGKFTTHADEVSGPLEKRFTRAVTAHTGTVATAIALALLQNHHRLDVAWLGSTRSPVYEQAAAYAALIAGKNKPNQPLNDKEIKGINAPPLESRATRTEIEALIAAGITPLEVGSGNRVRVVRAVTTYTKNAQGADDKNRRELGTVQAMDYCMTDIIGHLSTVFAGALKTEQTKKQIKSEILNRQKLLEASDILQYVEDNKDLLIVEDNDSDVNRVDVQIPLFVVGALHVIAIRGDLYLR